MCDAGTRPEVSLRMCNPELRLACEDACEGLLWAAGMETAATIGLSATVGVWVPRPRRSPMITRLASHLRVLDAVGRALPQAAAYKSEGRLAD